jgi:protein-L-isoaspartate(D-aspartate) O-methyltransferase
VDIALQTVDRAYFCFDEKGNQLPQTSAPEMIARMLRALDVKPGFNVLEIGTGSGFSTALLVELVGPDGMVVTIDVDPPVSERARSLLSGSAYANVYITTGDGRLGWPSPAPYDRVVAWCSVDTVPQPWLDQSRPHTILVVPMRSPEEHWINVFHRSDEGRVVHEERFAGGFIPATATPFRPWEELTNTTDQP